MLAKKRLVKNISELSFLLTLNNICVKHTGYNPENIFLELLHICKKFSHIEYLNHAHITSIYYVGYYQ